MSIEFISAIILLVEFLIFFPIASYYRIKGKKLPKGIAPEVNKAILIFQQISNFIFMFILFLSVPFLILFDLYHPLMDWTTIRFLFPLSFNYFWLYLIGIIIFTLGIIILIIARLEIKECHAFPWEPSKKGEGFAQTGIYNIIRHPIYSSTFFLFIGYIIWFQSWLAIVCWIPFLLLIKSAFDEEKWLLKRFGKEYQTYMKRTGRFIPKLRKSAKNN